MNSLVDLLANTVQSAIFDPAGLIIAGTLTAALLSGLVAACSEFCEENLARLWAAVDRTQTENQTETGGVSSSVVSHPVGHKLRDHDQDIPDFLPQLDFSVFARRPRTPLV